LKLEQKIKVDDVKDFLKQQDPYTIHRDITRKFTRQPVIVSGIDAQWQADLVIMPEMAQYNDNYPNILTVIDVFSKFAWAIPLKTKFGIDVINAFEQIFRISGRKPEKLQTDKGTEFKNKEFQTFLKQQNVIFFTTESELKASICERFNRTLKTRMWRYLTHNNTKRYIDVLDDLVHSYNNTIHRTIGIEPSKVNETNQDKIWKRMYANAKPLTKNSKPKFFVNEAVRLNSMKLQFEKGYTGNWTDEIFFVDKIYSQYLPFMYRIRDSTDEVLRGRFYEKEMQSVKVDEKKIYKIERIVKRRKRKGVSEVLVKWEGYPSSANTWEPEADLLSI